ncbi:putative membrane protein YedE/YeeE [Methylorubrum extorquens]
MLERLVGTGSRGEGLGVLVDEKPSPTVLAGLLLTLSGRMSPEMVLGFVDVAGEWDPCLAFVHTRAVGISAFSYRLKAWMAQPLLAPRFEVPTNPKPSGRLIGGALFGIG